MTPKKVKKDPSLQSGFPNPYSISNSEDEDIIIKGESSREKSQLNLKSNKVTSLSSPGKMGDFDETENWKCGIIEYFYKKDAEKFFENNKINFVKPLSGKYYLIVKVRCERIEGKEEFLEISNYNFGIVGDKKLLYHSDFLGMLTPEITSSLLVGGSNEGWLTFQVSEDDGNFILIFEDTTSWEKIDRIYLSLDY